MMLANNLENVPLLGHAASERSAIRDRRVTAFTKFQFGAVLTKQVRDVKRKKDRIGNAKPSPFTIHRILGKSQRPTNHKKPHYQKTGSLARKK